MMLFNIYTLLCLQGFGFPIGGWLERNYGPRIGVALGAILVVLGTLLASLAIQGGSLVGLFMTAGATFGFGCGLAFMCPLLLGYRWLPRHRGFVSGIVVAGYGGGALVFDQVSTHFANPENIPVQSVADDDAAPDDLWNSYLNCDTDASAVCGRASSMYLVLGCCYTAIFMIGISLMSSAPKPGSEPEKVVSEGYSPLEDTKEVAPEISSAAGAAEVIVPPPPPANLHKFALHPMAQLLFLSFVCTGTPGVFIAGSYKAMAVSHFSDDRFVFASTFCNNRGPRLSVCVSFNMFLLNLFLRSPHFAVFYSDGLFGSFLTNVGSLASIGNCSGRMFWGTACDVIGWELAIVLLSAGSTALIATYGLVAQSEQEGTYLPLSTK